MLIWSRAQYFYSICTFCAFCCLPNTYSQDLEPGSLSSVPIGGNFAIAAYGRSSGKILINNSLPIEGLNARLNNFVLGYAHSFKLFNKVAKFDAIIPYAFGDFKGLLEGVPAQRERNGLGDPSFRFSIILLGLKPLKPADFFKEEQKKFKLGVSLRVSAPLGQYDADRLINLGTNRWSFKTGLAGSYTIKKKLIFELQLDTWLFTDNSDFFGGNIQSQEPLFGAQLHATYIFKPGFWLALSLGEVFGGTVAVNGVENEMLNNSRYGMSLAYKLSKHHSLKASFSNRLLTSTGNDFNTFLIAYQFMWFNK